MAATFDIGGMTGGSQATRLNAITGRFDGWIYGPAIALACLGVVMVGSAGIGVMVMHKVGATYFLSRHVVFLCIGAVLAALAMRTELKWIEQRSQLLLLACVVALLVVFVPGLGVNVNGARRWINLGVSNFQAVEAVKLLYIVWLASYLKRYSEEVSATWPAMLKPLGVAVGLVGLLLLQPDFGSSALLLAITGGMLVLGGVNMPRMFGPVLVLLPALAVVAMAAPYRMRRLTSFLNPWDDPFNSDYQLTNALMAAGRGEWTGVGIGASVQKLSYLPEAHTDFIMAVIAEELGFVGVCAVVALYALLVGRALWTGLQCVRMRRHFSGYIAFGIALWIGLQAFVSIGVNLGMLPTKGLTLPLISSGGSSVLMTLAAVGLLLRVSYELDRAQRQVARLRGDAGTGTHVSADTPPSRTSPTRHPRDAGDATSNSTARSPVAAPDAKGIHRLNARIEPTMGRNA